MVRDQSNLLSCVNITAIVEVVEDLFEQRQRVKRSRRFVMEDGIVFLEKYCGVLLLFQLVLSEGSHDSGVAEGSRIGCQCKSP